MTITLKADASGNSGSIQVAGVDRLTLNTDGSLVAGANPATGSRSMALATMQKFADEFGASLSASGYQKLPSGLIIQWGRIECLGSSGAGGTTVSLPIAFPTAALRAVGTDPGYFAFSVGVQPIGLSQIRGWGKNVGTYADVYIDYLIIGY